MILVLFTVPFYHFFFLRYLVLAECHLSSDILVPFPDLCNLYICDLLKQKVVVVQILEWKFKANRARNVTFQGRLGSNFCPIWVKNGKKLIIFKNIALVRQSHSLNPPLFKGGGWTFLKLAKRG